MSLAMNTTTESEPPPPSAERLDATPLDQTGAPTPAGVETCDDGLLRVVTLQTPAGRTDAQAAPQGEPDPFGRPTHAHPKAG
ncbi:MAG: hypothetical protein JKY37_09685 [Nannocystaceae bacterium]|nr:hypothetical protein [Nannocystaceae bacterium]